MFGPRLPDIQLFLLTQAWVESCNNALMSFLQSLPGPVFQLQRPQHVPTVDGVPGALWLLHACPDTVGSGKIYCTLAHVASTHQHWLVKLTRKNHTFPTWKSQSSLANTKQKKKNIKGEFLIDLCNNSAVPIKPLEFIVPVSQKKSSLATTKAL